MIKLVLGILGFVGAQDPVGSTGCTAPSCVFANSALRFGTGTQPSVNAVGLFVQPWYFSPSANAWYKLTFSNYPLDTAIGTGTTGPNWSGATVTDLYSLTASGSNTDYSNFVVDSSDTTTSTGHGKIVATRLFTVQGQLMTLENTFSLGRNDSFVKIVTRVINNSSSPIENMIIWTGTRDDYVGTTDVNTKTRGNLNTGSFVAVTANNQSSRAIMITNTNEGVLFYSETEGVMTAYALCCSFSNVYNTNPLLLAPATPNPTDGSYAAVLPLGTIPVGGSGSITWYYAAGAVTSLSTVAQNVAAAQVADAPSMSQAYSETPSGTPSGSPSGSPSGTPSGTPSETPSGTVSPSRTSKATSTVTSTQTSTSTQTPTQTSTGSTIVIYVSPLPVANHILTVQLGNTVVPGIIAINVATIVIAATLLLCASRCCKSATPVPAAIKRNIFRPLTTREPETTVTIVTEPTLPNQTGP
jgi:hypothetical protein